MHVLKSFLAAVSMYSCIPVPQFSWEEEDLKYVFCFFPWIGALIGCCIYGWNAVCDRYQVGGLCRAAVDALIPLLVTGGFHADGFLDVTDALHSYQPQERKLEILKDSHIGAFAVIRFAAYGLVFLGAFSEIGSGGTLAVACAGFFLSRCLCGISAVSFPLAKKEGMLFQMASGSHKRTVRIVLYLQGALCIGLMLVWSIPAGACASLAAAMSLLYYYGKSRKEFGGISGDTSGYFVLLCEGCVIAAVAACGILS